MGISKPCPSPTQSHNVFLVFYKFKAVQPLMSFSTVYGIPMLSINTSMAFHIQLESSEPQSSSEQRHTYLLQLSISLLESYTTVCGMPMISIICMLTPWFEETEFILVSALRRVFHSIKTLSWPFGVYFSYYNHLQVGWTISQSTCKWL